MDLVLSNLRGLLGNQSSVLVLIFVLASAAAAVVLLAVIPVFETRRRLRSIAEADGRPAGPVNPVSAGGISEEMQTYYDTLLNGSKNAIRTRLVGAGYFRPNALYVYTLVRIATGILFFVAAYIALGRTSQASSPGTMALLAGMAGALGLILPNFILDRRVTARRERYREAFPDFLDMVMVCTDAGLSLEAAVQRVAKEFLVKDRAFGIHLGVLMLEVRAGKRLREAMDSLSERIDLEEAKQLASLFRQSEELGASLSKALRTHSKELRQLRFLRAEAKANALPVKLVIPLGAFIFPVTLMIVLVPVMIRLLEVFENVAPSS
jgi:tight adherence protein C